MAGLEISYSHLHQVPCLHHDSLALHLPASHPLPAPRFPGPSPACITSLPTPRFPGPSPACITSLACTTIPWPFTCLYHVPCLHHDSLALHLPVSRPLPAPRFPGPSPACITSLACTTIPWPFTCLYHVPCLHHDSLALHLPVSRPLSAPWFPGSSPVCIKYFSCTMIPWPFSCLHHIPFLHHDSLALVLPASLALPFPFAWGLLKSTYSYAVILFQLLFGRSSRPNLVWTSGVVFLGGGIFFLPSLPGVSAMYCGGLVCAIHVFFGFSKCLNPTPVLLGCWC